MLHICHNVYNICIPEWLPVFLCICIWSFAKKAVLCTPCAVSAVCYTGSRPGAHKGSRHGAHKVCTSHGAHKGAHKYKGCAHLVPGTCSKDMVRTMVRTRFDGFGAHKLQRNGAHKLQRNGAHKGAHKALGVKGFFANYHIYIYIYI